MTLILHERKLIWRGARMWLSCVCGNKFGIDRIDVVPMECPNCHTKWVLMFKKKQPIAVESPPDNF